MYILPVYALYIVAYRDEIDKGRFNAVNKISFKEQWSLFRGWQFKLKRIGHAILYVSSNNSTAG